MNPCISECDFLSLRMIATQLTHQQKLDVKSLSRSQLQQLCVELGLPAFRGDQIFQWLYQKRATSFEEMTNLPKDLRSELEKRCHISLIKESSRQTSRDGTTKFLFRLGDDKLIESVLIPDFYEDGAANRLTVCVSSQVGCVFGCRFCATGKMGFFRNLIAGEIVDQLQIINDLALERFGKKITNIVYMGMGEPFHNYKAVITSAHIVCDPLSLDMSPRRITISTVGLAKQIQQYATEKQPFNLALSLHAAIDQKRNEIMPINESMNLKELRAALEYYYQQCKQPVTYEYLLFDHFNDKKEDAQALCTIVNWIPSKVNIIMYNNVAEVSLQRAKEDRLNRFLKLLTKNGVRATVRRSRGDDIDAGCGQLAIREGEPRGKTIAKN